MAGKVPDTDAIAQRKGRSKRSVHMMISLAIFAPDTGEAAVTGCCAASTRQSSNVNSDIGSGRIAYIAE